MGARHGPGTIPAEQRVAAKELVRRGTSYAEVQRLTGVSPSTCTGLRKEIEREGAGSPVAPSPGRRHLPLPPARAAAPLDPAPAAGQDGGRHPRTETPGAGASSALASETPPAISPPPAAAPPSHGAVAGVQSAPAPLPAPAPPPPPVDAGLGEDFAVLAEQERDVTLLVAQAKADGNYVAMERLTRTRIELRRGMAQLRPPPPVDPEADVSNTEAARLLVARIRKMVKSRLERPLQ